MHQNVRAALTVAERPYSMSAVVGRLPFPGEMRKHGDLVLVGVVAFVVRVLTIYPHLGLRSVMGYDDSVYFAGSQLLSIGRVPYRDFIFVQPPGVVLFPLPFAAIGQLFGGDIGFAGLRLAMIAVGVATAVMITALLRRYGAAAALTGGLLYATHLFTALPDRTYLLEPLLNFAVVSTFVLLRRIRPTTRSYVAVGFVMGAACTVKIWAGIDVIVLGAFIMATRGRKLAASWFGGVVGAAGVIIGPFVLLAPGQLWRQVVAAQYGRPSESDLDLLTLVERSFGLPWTAVQVPEFIGFGVVVAAVVATGAPLWIAVRKRLEPRKWDEPAWWTVLAVAEVSTLAVAPTFFPHYLCWPAVPVFLCIGWVAGRLSERLGDWQVTAAVGLVAFLLVWVPLRGGTNGYSVGVDRLRQFASNHRCTWIDQVEVEVLVTSRHVPIGRPCRSSADPIGSYIVLAGGSALDPDSAFRNATKWQAMISMQISRADSAILCRPRAQERFSARNGRLFDERFTRVGRAGGCTLWEVSGTE